jgi:cell division protein FtsB
MNRRKTASRKRTLIIGLIGLLILLFLLSVGKRGFIQQLRIRRERVRLENEIQTLEARKSALEEEKDKLNDPDEVEKVARESYGMARDKEKVYRVIPKEEK